MKDDGCESVNLMFGLPLKAIKNSNEAQDTWLCITCYMCCMCIKEQLDVVHVITMWHHVDTFVEALVLFNNEDFDI